MNIVFNRVVGHNFLSISDCDLTLSNNGYVIIDGVNNYQPDLAKSNGAGKSSIFEMVVWALTGETIRGIKSSSIVNVNGDDGTFVDLYLKIDGSNWRVLRSKEHREYKTNLRIWKNDEELSGKGIKDTEHIFENIFPDLTLSLIGSVMVLGQGLPQRFSGNTPSGRKEVLEKLSKSDYMISDLKERVRNRQEELNDEIRDSEDCLLRAETKLSMQKEKLEEHEKSLGSMIPVEDIEKEIRLNKEDLQKHRSILSEMSSDLKVKEEELSDVKDSYSKKYADMSDTMSNISSSEAKELSALNEEYSGKVIDITNSKSSIEAEISSLTKEINRLKSIVDVCPTCGQKLQGVEKPDTSDMEKELAGLKESLTAVSLDLSSCKEEKRSKAEKISSRYKGMRESAEEKWKAFKSSFDSKVSSMTSALLNIKSDVDKESNTVSQLEKDAERLKYSLEAYNSQKEYLEAEIFSLKDLIIKTRENILYIISKKENLSNRLDIISKFNTSLARDFRGVLLESLIDYINTKAKMYSSYIFNTENIRFELDGNNISIGYNGKQYEGLSGGEKQKVDLIVQFSIRDMLCKFLNFSCNILVIDEIFDNLDMVGCNRVINMISSKLSDIDSIYIITHHDDLEIPNDVRWVITKNEFGVSSVNGVL